jgi:hypothetical protein
MIRVRIGTGTGSLDNRKVGCQVTWVTKNGEHQEGEGGVRREEQGGGIREGLGGEHGGEAGGGRRREEKEEQERGAGGRSCEKQEGASRTWEGRKERTTSGIGENYLI